MYGKRVHHQKERKEKANRVRQKKSAGPYRRDYLYKPISPEFPKKGWDVEKVKKGKKGKSEIR